MREGGYLKCTCVYYSFHSVETILMCSPLRDYLPRLHVAPGIFFLRFLYDRLDFRFHCFLESSLRSSRGVTFGGEMKTATE